MHACTYRLHMRTHAMRRESAWQVRLLSACSALLAVHGQAMAWVLFLPSAEMRTAAVEIFPAGLVNPIYRELSTTLGVHYESLNAYPVRGCAVKLSCNVTVDVTKVVAAARRAAAWAT